MKRGLRSLLVLAVFGLIFVSLVGIVDAVCPSDIISYWKLDESAGNTASDSFGINHGTLNNMDDSDWVSGQVGNALEFDGDLDYVEVADNGDIFDITTGEQMSISVWINFSSGRLRNSILGKGTAVSDLFVGADNVEAGKIEGCIGGICATSDNTLNDNNWHYLVYVVDDVSNEQALWVDTVKQADTETVTPPSDNPQPLVMGYGPTGQAAEYWEGSIDELAIYDRALTPAEIQNSYYKGLKEKGYCEDLCLSEDDIIMKLYSSTNSHGALWDDVNYNYDICYSDIFGTAYTGASPQVCSGNNKVLGLYAASNAHAEIPSLDDYGTDVCYGDLVCEAKTDPELCPADYEIVVRLYQDSNSHISGASDTNYPIKICCTSGVSTGDIYWANMLDTQISSADLGDTVKLIANIPGEEGKDITFEIWDINDILGVDWLWPDSKVDSTTGIGFTKWITDTEDTFYFRVDVDRDGTFDYSSKGAPFGELAVSGPEDNSPPTATIINPPISLPRANRRFKVGTAINFEKTVEDVDDDLEVTWDFDDGNTKTCINSEEDCDTVYSYSVFGTKVVKLTAKEIGRGQEDSDYTRVFIYDEGINVFALITKPLFGEIFGTGARVVQFNASESYVADCTTGSCSPPYGEACYNVGDLECYDLSKDYISTDYELWFDWTFSEPGDDGGGRYGNWTNNYDYVAEFKRPFFEPKTHWANLKVGYEEK